MKTPAALVPPTVVERVRKVTANTPLQPEKPTATRNAAGSSRPVIVKILRTAVTLNSSFSRRLSATTPDITEKAQPPR